MTHRDELDPREVRDELDRRALQRKGVHKVLSDRFPGDVNEKFDRDVQALLEQHFGGRQLGQVLEIGMGIGRLAHFFAKVADRYVGVDFSKEMLAHASYMLREQSNVEIILADANAGALDFPEQRFELGVVSLVLKHNNDPRAQELIGRLKRWCKEVLLIDHVEGGAGGSAIAVVRPESWYLEQFLPMKPAALERFFRHEDRISFCHFR
jgi:SAM-dependent methyltransferase